MAAGGEAGNEQRVLVEERVLEEEGAMVSSSDSHPLIAQAETRT